MAKDEKPEEKPEVAKGTDVESLIKEATDLGLKIPRISTAGFKGKKPEDMAREKARVKKQLVDLLTKMIAKAKALAKMKPIEKRRGVLVARLRVVKSGKRAHTYSDANLKAWIEELGVIDQNPKSWNKITVNGTKPYTPSNKRKKTAKDILDGMDLE